MTSPLLSYSVDLTVYDTNGNTADSASAIGSATPTLPLNGGQRYFIDVFSLNDSPVSYILHYYRLGD